MAKSAEPVETSRDSRPPVSDELRPKKQEQDNDRAIDRPIGQPERAREDQPIGWDMGPEGPRVVPGLLDEGEERDRETQSDLRIVERTESADQPTPEVRGGEEIVTGTVEPDASELVSEPKSGRLRGSGSVSTAGPAGPVSTGAPGPAIQQPSDASLSGPDRGGGTKQDPVGLVPLPGQPILSEDPQETSPETRPNTPPSIAGVTTGTVSEDDILSASGQLTAVDVDTGDSAAWSLPTGSAGAYGKLTVDAAGHWTYTLDNAAAQSLKAGDTVQEIFTVRATDTAGATVDQQVTVTVTGTNDAPVISGSSTGIVSEDDVLTTSGTLRSADVDVGDSAVWSLPTGSAGAYGKLTVDAAGRWIYTLDNAAAQSLKAGDTVQEIFTVRATDKAGATVDQQVTVTVAGTNDAPVISGSSTGIVSEDEVLTTSGALTSTDVDAGDSAVWSLPGGGDGSHGTLTVDADGRWIYVLDNAAAQTLKADETVQDIFIVRASDTAGGTTDQRVAVTVTGTNDAPLISGSYSGALIEDAALTASGILTAADVDVGDTAAWTVVGSGDSPYGAFVVNPDTGRWTYALDDEAAQSLKAGQTVQEIFTVRVTDAAGAIADQQVSVTITGTNDAPVIGGSRTGLVIEDRAPVAGGSLAVTDVDIGDTATWSMVGPSDGTYGAFAVDAAGRWTYTLDDDAAQSLKSGATVQEIFTVRATDTEGATADQLVSVTIIGTNDLPMISGSSTGNVTEDSLTETEGQLTVADPDLGDTATWSVTDKPYGQIVVYADGNWDYVPGGTPLNPGDTVEALVVFTDYGSVYIDSTGYWSYYLNDTSSQELKGGETVQEIFTVRVTDGAGGTADQQLAITITGTNDLPLISGSYTGAVMEDAALNTSGKLTAADPDIGDTATWSVVGNSDSPYGTLVVNPATGRWTYSLDNEAAQSLKAGETVQEIFTVRVTDAAGGTADQQVTITVSGNNDAPVISGTHTGAVAEDSALTANGQLTATDLDVGDTATWSVVGSADSPYGALALDPATGKWTYTLDNDAAQSLRADQTVQEIFTVRVKDAEGATAQQQIKIIVSGSNDVPVISGTYTGAVAEDGVATAEGQLTVADADLGDTATWSIADRPYGLIVTGANGERSFVANGNDAQLDSGETVEALVTQADYGTLYIDPEGSWTYHLDASLAQGLKGGETVQEIFTVRVTDAAGATVDQQVTITVTGTNDAPVISGSLAGAVTEDATLSTSGHLTAADADLGDTAAWSIVGSGDSAYGMLSINPDVGHWTYTLDNEAAQSLKAGETVQEIFTVRVTDAQGATTDQQVTVTVHGTNDAPLISGAYTGAVAEDGILAATGTLTATDFDVGDSAAWSIVGSADSPYGALVLDPATGQWTYTLDNQAAQSLKAGQAVQENFIVRVTDASGATADQRVTIAVTGTNDMPVISGSYAGAVTEDATLLASGQLTAADADIGDSATWSVVGSGDSPYGAFYVNPATGRWTYTLDNEAAQALTEGETVQEIFTVRVTDAAGGTVDQQVTIIVNGANDGPTIGGSHTGAVSEDSVLSASGTLTSTDTDIGDGATWSIVSNADSPYGALALDPATGKWTYTLDNEAAQPLKDGETVQEIFTVRVTDALGATADEQVTITISGTNDAPLITGTYSGAVGEDGTLTATGTLSATDVDIGDAAAWSIVGNPDSPYGALVLDPATGQWTYTLDNQAAQSLKAGDTVQEIFTVRVTDAAGGTAQQQVTVTVTGTNDTPVISGSHTANVAEDSALTANGQLTAADLDIGDSATWSIVSNPDSPYGAFYLNPATGLWTYQLDNVAAQSLKAGDTVQEIFIVRVTDAAGGTADQQVTVTVTGTNDAPLISGSYTGVVVEDAVLTTTGKLNATDTDIGDDAIWSIVSNPDSPYGALSLDPVTGRWIYTLDNEAAQSLRADHTVQEIFTVRVTDGAGGTADQQIAVTIKGANDKPEISGTYTGTASEDGVLTASGTLTAEDEDAGDSVTWSVAGPTTGSYGSLTVDATTGVWTYTLDNAAAQSLAAGETVQEVFTVRATDADEGAATDQQVTITISGTNDAPVISGTTTGAVVEDSTPTATGQLTATDVDVGDTAAWAVVGNTAGNYGTFFVNPDTGRWTYSLDNEASQSLKAGETVQETFTVRVTDAAGGTTDQQVTLSVTGTNDAPVVGQSLSELGTMKEEGTFTFTADDLLRGAQITDVDNDTLTVTNVVLDPASPPGTLTDNGNGSWTYRPGTNVSNVSPRFDFTVSDGTTTVMARASIEVQPVADAANVSLGADALRQVIDTGDPAYYGRIVEDTITSAPLSEFTLEVMLLAEDVPESTSSVGPVIVNVGSATDNNVLTLWNPANLTLGFSGNRNVETGIDLTDGQDHRLTTTWDIWSGDLRLYDNGELVYTTWMWPPPSDLYISIAQKPGTPPNWFDPDGSNFRMSEHFEGDIYYVTMANKAETPTQVATGPLTDQVSSTRLLVDIRAVNGQIVDTTGHQHLDPQGGLHVDTMTVDTSTSAIPAGSVLNLDVGLQPTDPNDTVTHLEISGFLAGTVLSDGIRYVTVLSPSQKVDITNWSLGKLTADLPNGLKTNMTMTLEATVTTPPYDTGEVDGNGRPIMTTDSVIVTEQHDIFIEYAPETQLAAQTASEPLAAEPMLMATAVPEPTDPALDASTTELAPSSTDSTTEPGSTDTSSATDPYLELAQPQAQTTEATATEASPTDPYLALASSTEQTTSASTDLSSPTTDYAQLATDSGTATQDPPPADQLYADSLIGSGDAQTAPTTEVQPVETIDETASVPPPPPEDPLAVQYV
ncbi:VCBS domain-containing protein [Bradyrhizobium diazoefficiens]|nr:VCBS domain-containing protein [Bradyrhizobium diazoefficiens]MBR0777908.1 VCBS domain-containing protein [Bradyrhizobium diazoefficiens]